MNIREAALEVKKRLGQEKENEKKIEELQMLLRSGLRKIISGAKKVLEAGVNSNPGRKIVIEITEEKRTKKITMEEI